MSLTPLLVALTISAAQGHSLWRQFRLGVATGVVYFCGTLYWLALVMKTHGNLSLPVAGLLAFGLAAYLSVFVGAFSSLVGISVRKWGARGLWLAPVFWVSTEWLRAWLGAAFPWVLLGSSQTPVLPVVQLASVTGVYGLSTLLALVSTAAAALAIRRDRSTWRKVLLTGLLLVAVATWGAWRLGRSELNSHGKPIRIGLLQGNVPQELKSKSEFREAITERYITLSRQAIASGAQLVLWPEASTPFYFDLESAMAEPVRRLAAQARVPFVVGTDELERGTKGEPDRFYNTAVLVDASGRSSGSYRKILLVPFGEYVPFKTLLFFVGPLIEAVSDFSAGTDPTVFDANGVRFSVAICYEAIYARMARTFVAQGAELLTTITNDAWFERSSAAYQHFDQAALRAVEQGRYLVRAANTGFSGAVDPYGRVIARTQLFESAAIAVDVRLLSGRTIYGLTGDVVAYLALMLSAIVIVVGRRAPGSDARTGSRG